MKIKIIVEYTKMSPYRSTRLLIFYEKDVLKNFAKFTGKHLCQSLFLNKVKNKKKQLCLKRDSSRGAFL